MTASTLIKSLSRDLISTQKLSTVSFTIREGVKVKLTDENFDWENNVKSDAITVRKDLHFDGKHVIIDPIGSLSDQDILEHDYAASLKRRGFYVFKIYWRSENKYLIIDKDDL